MNLIEDAWIPTDAGTLSPIDALQHASEIQWGRGDWDTATQVLLIAMMQSAIIRDPMRCGDEGAWDALCSSPPDDLSAWLRPLVTDFDGSVFEMPVEVGDRVPVSGLLPDAPGESTVNDKCSDILAWHHEVQTTFTEPEARIALYSDALWGVRWGRGHRQGVRGESRMLTLVEPEQASLWQRVWLNVLPHQRWITRFGDTAWDDAVFPWRHALRHRATPADSHPLLVYWAMPRRIRTEMVAGTIVGLCRQSGGTDYVDWRHPLTPYIVGTKGTAAAKIFPGHLGYADWAGIATTGRPGWQPAAVVNEFIERRWEGEQLRLRVCGWSLGASGETAAWVEQAVPLLLTVDPALVEDLLADAEKVMKGLERALNKVLGKLGKLQAVRIYDLSESDFYQRVTEGDAGDWKLHLRRVARRIFDEITDQHRIDPIEIAMARKAI